MAVRRRRAEKQVFEQPAGPSQSELLERARSVTPGGSQTLSKASGQWMQGPCPAFIVRGDGSHVWDADGREFIDYPMALGPVLLGHRFPAVDRAIREQLDSGILFSLPHPLEVHVAEQLVDTVPCAEMVRFCKTGSEATAAAIRLARAATGRDTVLFCGYHGWHDWYAGRTSRNAGVPKVVASLALPFRFNDAGSLSRLLDIHAGKVAAVILEPAAAVAPSPGFLEQVARLTWAAGAVLVFDEVITGLRWARGGAQERYGIQPDLACLGKALGNGMPISALCGRADLMKQLDELFVSGTHGGECLSLAAARAVLRVSAEEPVVESIWKLGGKLSDGISEAIDRHGLGSIALCTGEAPRPIVRFLASAEEGLPHPAGGVAEVEEDLVLKSLLQQELAKRGILFNGSLFVSYSHTAEDIARTVEAFDAAFGVVKEAVDSGEPEKLLVGPPLQPVFRPV